MFRDSYEKLYDYNQNERTVQIDRRLWRTFIRGFRSSSDDRRTIFRSFHVRIRITKTIDIVRIDDTRRKIADRREDGVR